LGAQSEPLSIVESLYPEKNSFMPSKWPQKLKTAKNSKLPKLPENCFERVGKGGWPPISTWINNPSLGINGIHFVDFPHHMRKFLLNLAPGEPLVLVQELPCFDDSIKLDPLLSISLDLCVQNLIIGCLLHAIRVDIYWFQLLCYL
jgi:hypothetical protein